MGTFFLFLKRLTDLILFVCGLALIFTTLDFLYLKFI